MLPITLAHVHKKILSKEGFGLVEVLIAMLLTALAVISLLPMQDTSIRTAGKSDLMGRAAGVLQTQLESIENQIMLGTIPADLTNQPVKVAAGSVTEGNTTLYVTTRITQPVTNQWLANVRIAWPGNCFGGSCSITNSIVVTRQSGF